MPDPEFKLNPSKPKSYDSDEKPIMINKPPKYDNDKLQKLNEALDDFARIGLENHERMERLKKRWGDPREDYYNFINAASAGQKEQKAEETDSPKAVETSPPKEKAARETESTSHEELD